MYVCSYRYSHIALGNSFCEDLFQLASIGTSATALDILHIFSF